MWICPSGHRSPFGEPARIPCNGLCAIRCYLPPGFLSAGHTFEVSRDGCRPPRKVIEHGMGMGTFLRCLHRSTVITFRTAFPLHLCYRFEKPGSYHVRYVLPEHGVLPTLTSAWVTLQVQPMTVLEQRRRWQQEQLAHPPTDAGLLVGDYLPSLLCLAGCPGVTGLPGPPASIECLREQLCLAGRWPISMMTYGRP